jgi:hypothetical protein
MINLIDTVKASAADAYMKAMFLYRDGLMPWDEVVIISELFCAVSRAQASTEIRLQGRGAATGEPIVDLTNVVAFTAPKRRKVQ